MVKQGGRKQKNTPKIGKHQWVIGGAIIALSTLLLVFLSWFFYTGSTKEIVAVADQFKPDSSWELVSENIQPPATVCIDVECPSIWRQWRSNTTASSETFRSLLKQVRWNLKIDTDCNYNDAGLGKNLKLCSASGVTDNYLVEVTIRNDSTPSTTLVGLSIKKE